MSPVPAGRHSCVEGVDGDAIVMVVDGDVTLTSWPVHVTKPPDLSVVEELARLQLAARRLGWSIRVVCPCPRLRELLDLVGLVELLVDGRRSVVEMGGEAEGGEQVGVEEVVMPDDPIA
jgi:hypothetical protein